MISDKYRGHLNELKNRFNVYKNNLEIIIDKISEEITQTVITEGEIANFTPFYKERLGSVLNGKVIQQPIISDDCMKYHYDSDGRIVMVEEYSVFLKKFCVTEIYIRNIITEKLLISSCGLIRLFALDNVFSRTLLCMSYAEVSGFCVERFVYNNDRLSEIDTEKEKNSYKDILIYESDKLVKIERISQSGTKSLIYTTKKPDFSKIYDELSDKIKSVINEYSGNFNSFGIEGFIDQQYPMIYISFSEEEYPSDLIAEWDSEMIGIQIYDWQLSDEEEEECVRIIVEILSELVNENILKDKQIFFHQSQVCVTEIYQGIEDMLKKANINVL